MKALKYQLMALLIISFNSYASDTYCMEGILESASGISRGLVEGEIKIDSAESTMNSIANLQKYCQDETVNNCEKIKSDMAGTIALHTLNKFQDRLYAVKAARIESVLELTKEIFFSVCE